MTVVYIREPGSTVRKDGETLKVIHRERVIYSIPLADLEQLVLMGNIQITTQAAVMLMRRQIDVVFMSQYGSYRGRMLTLESKFAELRHLQLRLCDDEARSLQLARKIVQGKITNQRVVLQRRIKDTQLLGAVDGMANMLKSTERAATLDQLRGFEGKAAAYYFQIIRALIRPEWEFRERSYYPPPDPFNALLSFIYTLLRKDVEAQIQLVGLDPYLGFFHALGYDRPGLALDIMEEFRPTIADIVTLSLTQDEQITLADFERTNDSDLPVRMTKQAMNTVVQAYELRMADKIYHPLANGQTDYRRAIELQVRRMARVVRQEEAQYIPLVIK